MGVARELPDIVNIQIRQREKEKGRGREKERKVEEREGKKVVSGRLEVVEGSRGWRRMAVNEESGVTGIWVEA
jgi:hypothetical protein